MSKYKKLFVFSILQISFYLAGSIADCAYNPIDDSEETRKVFEADKYRDAIGVIKARGFEAEEHEVVTQDGYILRIQRIINPLVAPEQRDTMKPVVLQHGLITSPIDFIIDSPNVKPAAWPKPIADDNDNIIEEDSGGVYVDGRLIDTQEKPNALGFFLANRGYDVWLTTFRGTIYGQTHISLSSKDSKFWDFSLDELIMYDLPDTIEFILRQTRKEKLAYIGHSQGATVMFALLSDKPHFADIIEPFIALAPVVYIGNVESRMRLLKYVTPYLSHINSPVFGFDSLLRRIMPYVCEPKFIMTKFCKTVIHFLTGFNENKTNLDRSTSYLAHTPTGTSVKILSHFGQWSWSNKFAHFSDGKKGNLKRYNSEDPPLYDLSKIKSRAIVLFVSDSDPMVSERDLARLVSELPFRPHSISNMSPLSPGWNHMDHLHSLHAGELINPRIYKVLQDFN